MPAKPAKTVAESLTKTARGTQGYLDRLEQLHKAGALTQRDVTRAYEGAFLRYYTDLERHLERLFMGLLMSRFAVTGNSRSLVQIRSEQVARQVLIGERNYVDWLPIQKTTDRAKTFLSRGKPFDRLSPADKDALHRMHLVRNAVAHQSGHALRKFRKHLVDHEGLPPVQRTPAGYLRGQHAPGQTRLSYFMAQGVQAMTRVCV
jgi:hypothetical protein